MEPKARQVREKSVNGFKSDNIPGFHHRTLLNPSLENEKQTYKNMADYLTNRQSENNITLLVLCFSLTGIGTLVRQHGKVEGTNTYKSAYGNHQSRGNDRPGVAIREKEISVKWKDGNSTLTSWWIRKKYKECRVEEVLAVDWELVRMTFSSSIF